MNVPADWTPGHKELSFEEKRIEDYAAAMRKTGKPPPPCPEQPTSDSARRALGLPPLFTPYIDTGGPRPTSGTSAPVPGPTPASSLRSGGFGLSPTGSGGAVPGLAPAPSIHPLTNSQTLTPTQGGVRVTNPSELPPFQVSAPGACEAENGDVMLTLSCQRQYSFFSQEELRFYGTKSKTPIPPVLLSYNNEGATSMMTMSAAPQFALHSLEEHRIAFLLSGRELSSEEINKHIYRL
ncbi:hypothetical protein EVG20_g10466 [Dentipellis fragilis]|uniref:Uncharacterized protein n=1 Tax=Dentipellis fragilis TaxID=205917 RepID=A0A4Y9XRD3_9AGAM|nr:hypothetical protein EVG20_g10466 [Dentipellis fragilis]